MAAAILATLAGCAAQTAREPGAPEAAPAGPTPAAIANARYRSGFLEGAEVTLRDGRYERGDGFVAWLLPAPMARGDIGGRPVAAVLIAEAGGGTGTFISLVLLRESDGHAVELASTLLGDRPRVKKVEIAPDGTVLVAMLQVGDKDAFCCPSTPMTVRYALVDGALAVRSLETGPRR
jgi:hypothetical protein